MKTSCVFSWSSCSFLAHLRLSVWASISSPTSCCSKARWLSDSAILPYKYQWSMSTIRAAGCASVGQEGLHGEKISAMTKTMMQSRKELCGPKCWVCMISLAKCLNQNDVFVFSSIALWSSSLVWGRQFKSLCRFRNINNLIILQDSCPTVLTICYFSGLVQTSLTNQINKVFHSVAFNLPAQQLD